MFRLITLEREYGSGGAEVAERIARDLGWRLLDQALIEAVARRAQVDVATARGYDERLDSWWHRWNRDGFGSAVVAAGATPADAQFFDAETMAAITEEVIRGAACKGNCVILRIRILDRAYRARSRASANGPGCLGPPPIDGSVPCRIRPALLRLRLEGSRSLSGDGQLPTWHREARIANRRYGQRCRES